jgi:transcriptional regulator with XRE-family HTH domain
VFVCVPLLQSFWSVQKGGHYRDKNAIKQFGLRVRELRIKKGLTIEEFANSVDLHVTQVGRIERGETNSTISSIFLIAKKLGVTPADLLNFD